MGSALEVTFKKSPDPLTCRTGAAMNPSVIEGRIVTDPLFQPVAFQTFRMMPWLLVKNAIQPELVEHPATPPLQLPEPGGRNVAPEVTRASPNSEVVTV